MGQEQLIQLQPRFLFEPQDLGGGGGGGVLGKWSWVVEVQSG